MPAFIKTKEDEKLWDKAKAVATDAGRPENWPYVTGIYKKMNGGKVASVQRVAAAATWPDTAQGAISFLSDQVNAGARRKLTRAKAVPDPQVPRVWKVTAPGLAAIVYLPGSLVGGAYGDFEEIEDFGKTASSDADIAARATALFEQSPQAAAEFLVKTYGDDAGVALDDMRREFRNAGFTGRVDDLMDLCWRYVMDRKKAEMASSPFRKECEALTDVFTTFVSVDDIRYIVYQPVVRGGETISIRLTDRDSRLGHMTTSLTPQDARSSGTTLEKVLALLEAKGARLQKRSPPRPKYTPPLYD